MGQLFLGQAIQHIALIFGTVRCFVQQVPSGGRILPDLGVMSGDYIIAAQNLGPAEKMVKFQIPIAVDAGIGSNAAFVAADKFRNDLFMEFCFCVENMKGHPQLPGDAPGIFHIVQRAAGACFFRVGNFIVVQPHGGSHAVISCFQHQIGGNRAVHAAAHGYQSLLFCHCCSSCIVILVWSIATGKMKVNAEILESFS